MRLLFTVSVVFFFTLCMQSKSFAQSDLLILKKNGRTMQTFFPGSNLHFSTAIRQYDAYITSINKDSIFLVQYDIRYVPSNMGFNIVDTVARYNFPIYYKDIIAFNKYKGSFIKGSGAGLFGGGILLTTAGLITWIFAKPNTRYYARPELVGAAAALTGIGYLMMISGGKEYKLGKKYTLSYINVN
ncbi:MAG: hypothetical protein ABI266_09235 [Ginsengibacter sp.]